MITCQRCGKPASVGVANCQYCGMALTNTASERPDSSVASSMTARMGEQSQPELPAWLETLRSGERPKASTTGTPNFSAGDDEGMLPSWMRPDRSEMADNTPSGKYPAQRPASLPGPNTDNTFSPTRGMPASSLIDEQSLPPWLQEKQAAAQENIAAGSLVQPEALPDWMKTMQPQSPATIPPNPMQYQPPIPPQGIIGNDLIDRQELPPWLSEQEISAPNSGQAGLAASSLLDVDALPPWLREANQEQQRGSAGGFPLPAQPQQAPFSQVPDHQTAYNQLPNGQVPARNSNLPAASFIDKDALPDWLRPSEEQRQDGAFLPQQQGAVENAGQAPSGGYGAPARPDNMRVPSRPRGEIGSHEESEMAANVFASMLGVASTTPYFPGQQARDAYGHPQIPTPPPQTQQNLPQQALGSGTGYPAGPSMQSNVQGPGGYQGGYPMGTMPGGPARGGAAQQAMPMNTAGMQPGPAMNYGGSGQSKAKPARRGFLSTILDWFSR